VAHHSRGGATGPDRRATPMLLQPGCLARLNGDRRWRITRAVGRSLALRYPRAMIRDDLLSQLRVLSVAERIELIGVLWQTLPPEDLPVSTQDQALLDERLADLDSQPADQSPWAEACDRLRSALS